MVKIYELAKELGLPVKDLMSLVVDLKIADPKSHFAALSDDDADLVRRHVIRSAMKISSFIEEPEEEVKEEAEEEEPPQVVVRRRKGKDKEVFEKAPPQKRSGLEVPETLFGAQIADRSKGKGKK